MVQNDPFMQSWQPAINNLYKQYGAPFGNSLPADGALATAKALEANRKKAYDSYMTSLNNPKMTYQNAVTNLTNGTAPIKLDRQKGAYQQSEEIRNDPTMQQLLKDQGYNVNDYVNALYNVGSGGKFKSEREFNQYDSNIKKTTKANSSASGEPTQGQQNAITSAVQGKNTKAVMVPTTSPSQQPSGHGLLGLLGNIGHDIQNGYNRLVVKPTHAIENVFTDAVKQGKQNAANHQIKDNTLSNIVAKAKSGYTGKDQASGANLLNEMGIKNKTAQTLGGGALDFTLNPLNLVPYVGAEKLLGEGGFNIGSKIADQLIPKYGNVLSHAAGKGAQGMATGALGASADASLNPNLTPQQRLTELLQMGALGGIGGTLHGVGTGVNTALDQRISSMFPNVKSNVETNALSNPQELQDILNQKALPIPGLPEPKQTLSNTNQIAELEKAMNDIQAHYANGLKDHTDNGLAQAKQNFINKVSELHGQRSVALDSSKALADEYKNVKDAFPNGIQIPDKNKNDFKLPPSFKAKKGASSDIYQAAEQLGHQTPDDLIQHLNALDQAHKLVNRTAKKDVLGYSTAQQAEKDAASHFDNNLAKDIQPHIEQQFHDTPDAQAMRQTLETLQAHHQDLVNHQEPIPLAYVGRNDRPVGLRGRGQGQGQGQEEAINIDAQPEPPLHKMTDAEMMREANKEQFARNNEDPTIPETADHIMSKSDIPQRKVDPVEKFISEAVDNVSKLGKFDNAVVDSSGKELKATDSAYTQALNSRNADVTTEQVVKHEMVTPKGKVVVDKNGKPIGGLKDVIGKMKPKEFKAFNDYLTLKHAETRMSRGEKVYPDEKKMSPEKAKAKYEALEEKMPHFKELSNKVYKWNRALMREWLVKGGIVSEEDMKKFFQANPHYVPMNRVFDPNEAHMGQNAKKGFANQSNPVHMATGSERQIIDPIESMIEHANQYVKTVRRNEVGQAVVRALSKNPEDLKGWAEIVPTEKGSPTVGDALSEKHDLTSEDGIENFLESFNSAFDKKSDLTKGNIVRVLVKGKPVHIKVNDPGFLDALTNIQGAELPKWIKAIGVINRNFKVLTTGTNPIFMARNMTRDIPMAYANSTTLAKGPKGMYEFGKDLMHAYWDVISHNDSLQDFKNMGGGHASSVASTTNHLANTKSSLLPMKSIADLKEQGKNFAAGRFALDAVKRGHSKAIGGIERLSNAIETAPRLAEYKRTVQKGGGNYDSKVQGLYNANDVTVNFNRYGTQAKQLDQLVPYLNASIQGIDKFVRAAKDNPAQFATRVGVGIGLPAALSYLSNMNDPNYQQLPKYLKDQYFMIPKGDGTFVKIAKPREIGAVLDGLERSLDSLNGDPHAWQGYAQTLWSNFLPPTQAIDAPLIQVAENKSYTGIPIVSQSLANLSPEYRYDSKDTSAAKGLAKVANLIPMLPSEYKTPKAIDYLMKAYGGGAASLATGPKSAVSSAFTADPTFSNDIGGNFYNEQSKLDQAHYDMTKKGIKTADLNEPLRLQFDSQARQVSKIRSQMKAIQGSSMPSKQKNAQVKLYQQMINQLEQKANSLVH